MRITFLGTGTSMGIPMIGCQCRVCQSDNPKDERSRTSVWLEVKGVSLIIDTGIDFRQQALRNSIHTIDAVLFTHHHVDHIFGLDELRAINFLQKKSVHIYSNANTYKHLKRVYQYVFDDSCHSSDIPRIEHHLIDLNPFSIKRVKITPIEIFHGDLPILGFRIGDFAYCTDISYFPPKSYHLLKGLKVLVLGALRKRSHPTHFTIDEAVSEAKKIKAEKTYFVHMSHEVGHQELVEKLPHNIQPAYDGLMLNIG